MAKKSTTTTPTSSPAVVTSATFRSGVREERRVTPTQASNWLQLATKPIDIIAARKIAREILAGRHEPTGRNDIVFYDDGMLAYGQNELRGIVEAGVSHRVFITRGINRRRVEIDCVNPTMYFGRVRGVRYASAVVSAVRSVLFNRAVGGAVVTTRPSRIMQFSTTELWEEYINNRVLYDNAVTFAWRAYSRSGHALRISHTAAHYVFAVTELGCTPTTLNAFYDDLINSILAGTPLPCNDFMSRITADDRLRSQLMSDIFKKGYFTECWNNWRSGINAALTYTPSTHPGLRMV